MAMPVRPTDRRKSLSVDDVLNDCARLLGSDHNALRYCLPKVAVEASESLSNMSRFNTMMDSHSLPQHKSPPQWVVYMREDFFALPLHCDVKFAPVSFGMKDGQDVYFRQGEGKRFICIRDELRHVHRHRPGGMSWEFQHPLDDSFTDQQANQVARHLTDLYNRWPWAKITARQKKAQHYLSRLARERVKPDAAYTFNSVGWRSGYERTAFALDIAFVDVTEVLNDRLRAPSPKSHQWIYVPIPSINTALEVPAIPPQYTFRTPQNADFSEGSLTLQGG